MSPGRSGSGGNGPPQPDALSRLRQVRVVALHETLAAAAVAAADRPHVPDRTGSHQAAPGSHTRPGRTRLS